MDALTRYSPPLRGSGFVPFGMVPRLTNHASIHYGCIIAAVFGGCKVRNEGYAEWRLRR
jgi:hypothetical protein